MATDTDRQLDLDLTPTERAILEDLWTRRGLGHLQGILEVRYAKQHGDVTAIGGTAILKFGARGDERAGDEPLLRPAAG